MNNTAVRSIILFLFFSLNSQQLQIPHILILFRNTVAIIISATSSSEHSSWQVYLLPALTPPLHLLAACHKWFHSLSFLRLPHSAAPTAVATLRATCGRLHDWRYARTNTHAYNYVIRLTHTQVQCCCCHYHQHGDCPLHCIAANAAEHK